MGTAQAYSTRLEGSPGVRLAFYDGVVETFMPGQAHEIFKKIVGFLLEMFFFEKRIDVVPTGSVTQEYEGGASRFKAVMVRNQT